MTCRRIPEADASRHDDEIRQNKQFWAEKPVLQCVYREFYGLIRERMQVGNALHSVVDIGSGIGAIKNFIPNAVTTDLFANPGIDQVQNIYALTLPDKSVDNVVMFDVWHHLEKPAAALRECKRVLAPGGRLIIMDPAMSLVGIIAYGCFHHEPLLFSHKFNESPEVDDKTGTQYFAAQSAAHKLFLKREQPAVLAGWKVLSVDQITSFAYLLSGGFRGPQVYPETWLRYVQRLDSLLGKWPAMFAARLLIILTPEVSYE